MTVGVVILGLVEGAAGLGVLSVGSATPLVCALASVALQCLLPGWVRLPRSLALLLNMGLFSICLLLLLVLSLVVEHIEDAEVLSPHHIHE